MLCCVDSEQRVAWIVGASARPRWGETLASKIELGCDGVGVGCGDRRQAIRVDYVDSVRDARRDGGCDVLAPPRATRANFVVVGGDRGHRSPTSSATLSSVTTSTA